MLLLILIASVSWAQNRIQFRMHSTPAAWASAGINDAATSGVVQLLTNGKIQIGATAPHSSHQMVCGGRLGASQYCDENGANCFTIESVSGTPTWVRQSATQYYYLGAKTGIANSTPGYILTIGNNKFFNYHNGCDLSTQVNGTTHARFFATTSTNDSNRVYIAGDAASSRIGTTRSRFLIRPGAAHTVVGSTANSSQLNFLATGEVGIGQYNPQASLEVYGRAGATTALMVSSNDANNGDLLRVTTPSKVQIGVAAGGPAPVAELEVNGTIRFAKSSSQPAACTAALAGAMSLNSSGRICICDGSAWMYVPTSGGACGW